MKDQCTNQTNIPEQYLIVLPSSCRVFKVSPLAYNKKGNMTIGVDKDGRLFVHVDISPVIGGTPFTLAINANKIEQDELEILISNLRSL